jgi:hypothetical protein
MGARKMVRLERRAQRGGQTPKHSSMSGNATPRPDGHAGDSPNAGLKPRPSASGSMSRPGSRSNSRAPSPAVSERRREEAEEDSMMTDTGLKVAESDIAADTPMAEVTETQTEAETPRVTIEEPDGEGQTVEEGEAEDKMDTT